MTRRLSGPLDLAPAAPIGGDGGRRPQRHDGDSRRLHIQLRSRPPFLPLLLVMGGHGDATATANGGSGGNGRASDPAPLPSSLPPPSAGHGRPQGCDGDGVQLSRVIKR
ncbi:hypothetical protein E2562_015247 [Oryza meyeriana var. granulata]|uniref:Uncharacterized protein n=1 Tax=Oryza meyeriana var. granulata TaxID=110450 RepID=A0A6G1DJC0_9ORYZ|nr:hypothetical protein E2562_015247 [Oryza meyeriana var. granulata]